VFKEKKAATFINRTFVPFKIVKGQADYDHLKDFFKMPGFPTVIVLGPDGVERDRMVGFGGDADLFVETLKSWSKNQQTLFSYLQTWAKDTTDVEWNYRIAQRYEQRYQNEFAQRFWKNVIQFDPENVAGYMEEATFRLSLYAAKEKSNPKPLRLFLAKTQDAEYLKSGYFALIQYYQANKDVEKTLEWYNIALQKFPDSIDMLNGCAWFIFETKIKDSYARGIRLARHALELDPKADYVWDTLAWLYHANGDYKEAVDAMSKALALLPDSDYFKQTLLKMKNDLENV